MKCNFCLSDKSINLFGNPDGEYLIIQDYPTEEELLANYPLFGKSANTLKNLLKDSNIPIESCYFTYAIGCRSLQNPDDFEHNSKCFHSRLDQIIIDFKGKYIVAMGITASKVISNNPKFQLHRAHGEVSNYQGKLVTFTYSPYTVTFINKNLYSSVVKDLKAITTQDQNSTKHNYRICNTPAMVEQMCSEIIKAGRYAFDFETTGVKWIDKIAGISFSWERGVAAYIPLLIPSALGDITEFFAKKSDTVLVIDMLKKLLTNQDLKATAHNDGFERRFAAKEWGIIDIPIKGDPLMASYLLDENTPNGLKGLLHRYPDLSGYEDELYKWLEDNGLSKSEMWQAPIRMLGMYGCGDADGTLRLTEDLAEEIVDQGLELLLYDYCIPLQKTLTMVEMRGLLVDVDYANKTREFYETENNELLRKIIDFVGKPINPISSIDMAWLLYEKLGLKTQYKINHKGDRVVATDGDVLDLFKAENPICEDIKTYRKNTQLIGTVLKGILEDHKQKDNIVHTEFKIAKMEDPDTVDSKGGTGTGRLASKNPNMQNPTDRAKLIFIARPGYKFFQVDASQAEVRGLAHYSNDAVLIDAFTNKTCWYCSGTKEVKGTKCIVCKGKGTGEDDIHIKLYSQIKGYDYYETFLRYVAKEAEAIDGRRATKSTTFGIIYGAGPEKISKQNSIPLAVAQQFYNDFFDTLPGAKRFIEDTKQFCHDNGYVVNCFGRRRRLPLINCNDKVAVLEAERQAVNAVIQSTAADLVGFGMIRLATEFDKRDINSYIVGTVHDSVLIEADEGDYFEIAQFSKQVLEDVVPDWFRVRIRMDLDFYTNRWGEKAE